MNRLSFYNIDKSTDVDELDYLYNSLSKFNPQYPVGYYRVTDADLMRPDLISFKAYGTADYWWLILAYNDIADALLGMKTGDLLKVPSLLDVYEFYKQYHRKVA